VRKDCKKYDRCKTTEVLAWVMKQKYRANYERFILSEEWGFLCMKKNVNLAKSNNK
jgi:hypothetical protein